MVAVRGRAYLSYGAGGQAAKLCSCRCGQGGDGGDESGLHGGLCWLSDELIDQLMREEEEEDDDEG